MKPKSNFLEFLIWALTLVPLVYMLVLWQDLPARVPIHFNLEGQPDNWGSKNFLIGIIILLTLGINLLLLIVPNIDPKEKLKSMGSKYQQLRFMMSLFMNALAVFILYHANTGSLEQSNFVYLLIGLLFIVLGNYFQAIKPNYFIGIRTPWTLESETVWRKTHRLGGRLWMAGGAVMCISALIPNPVLRLVVFFGTGAIVAFVPVIYSFIEQRKESRRAHSKV